MSSKSLENLIKTELNHLPKVGSSRLIIGGFSQGGTIAINSLLKSKQNFAGCVNLSGYMIQNKDFSEIKTKIETPILHCHGENDIKGFPSFNLTIDLVEFTSKIFKEHAKNYEFHSIPNMGHEVNNEVLNLLSDFIHKQLPPI